MFTIQTELFVIYELIIHSTSPKTAATRVNLTSEFFFLQKHRVEPIYRCVSLMARKHLVVNFARIVGFMP